jgi:nucleotide-binding universal stress UspA family protein/predicted transcriptional regulator
VFKTILVPLDGSPIADRALPYALSLARRARGKVLLVHGVWNALFPRETDFHIHEKANEIRALAPDVPIESQVWGMYRSEDLGSALGHACRELGADLIVMSTHGRSGLGRLLYGSVADQVLRETHVPVLLIPAACEYEWPDEASRPLRALVALDGSPYAEEALALAGELPNGDGPELVLMRVVNPPSDTRVGAMSLQQGSVGAEQYLSEMGARLRATGRKVDTHVKVGSPPDEIVAATRETGADLVAMATHGRSGLARLTLGSVATEALRQACVPLLLVRPAALQAPDPRATHARIEQLQPDTNGLKAGQLMRQPVVTVREDTTLAEVAKTMLQHEIGCVPVVDEKGEMQGIITESDFTGKEQAVPYTLFRAPHLFGQWIPKQGIETIYRAAQKMPAREIMSAPVVTASEDDPLGDVVMKMIRRDIKHVPVVRDRVPIGVIARHDLLRLMVMNGDGPQAEAPTASTESPA